MKVKELIEKLQTVDEELEVFAAPSMVVPVLNDPEASARIGVVELRYPIDEVQLIRSLRRQDEGAEYLIIAFNDDPNDAVMDEFVN